jgi:hypothetical protein
MEMMELIRLSWPLPDHFYFDHRADPLSVPTEKGNEPETPMRPTEKTAMRTKRGRGDHGPGHEPDNPDHRKYDEKNTEKKYPRPGEPTKKPIHTACKKVWASRLSN